MGSYGYRWGEHLSVTGPKLCAIEVASFGQVEVTAHAVEQYCERFDRPERKAWRDLVKIARHVEREERPNRSVFHDLKHARQGQFAINRARIILMVITPPEQIGRLPKLVTVYARTRYAKTH